MVLATRGIEEAKDYAGARYKKARPGGRAWGLGRVSSLGHGPRCTSTLLGALNKPHNVRTLQATARG